MEWIVVGLQRGLPMVVVWSKKVMFDMGLVWKENIEGCVDVFYVVVDMGFEEFLTV